MRYQIINPVAVKQKLDSYMLQNGDEVIVSMYLTMRDPQFNAELYHCINEYLDEKKLVDVLVMGEQIHIHSDADILSEMANQQPYKEYDFSIRWWRRAQDSDIKYNTQLRPARAVPLPRVASHKKHTDTASS